MWHSEHRKDLLIIILPGISMAFHKIHYAMLLCLFLSFPCIAAENLPQQPDWLQQKIESGLVFYEDVRFLENMGSQDCSAQTQIMVRNVLRAFDVYCSETIRIRRLSKIAMYNGYGPMQFLYFCFLNQYFFIDEDWFNSLPDEDKIALVARQAIYLKEQHNEALWAGTLGCLAVGGGLCIGGLEMHNSYTAPCIAAAVAVGMATPFVVALLSRYLTCRADRGAVMVGCGNGAIDVFKRYQHFDDECEAERAQWKVLVGIRKMIKFVSKPFNLMPTHEERIKALKEFAQEHGIVLDGTLQA